MYNLYINYGIVGWLKKVVFAPKGLLCRGVQFFCSSFVCLSVRPSVRPSVCCNHFLIQKSAASRAVFDVSWVQKRSKSDHITENEPKKRSFTGDNRCFAAPKIEHKSHFGATLALRVLSSKVFQICKIFAIK